MNFGKWMIRARKRARMTQQQLADLLGVHFSTISHWENERRAPPYQDCVRLARALDASEDEALRAAGYEPLEKMTAR